MENVEQQLLSLEQARCEALLTADTAKLDELLSPRLVFTHAHGLSDTKDTFLEKMRQAKIVYRRLKTTEAKVIELNDSAILLCRLTADILVAGAPKQLDNRTLSVWAIEDEQFRLIAYQATPITA
ncbi:nuclear transport factor 2 family protein [Caballeronia novacaledonica]|uniref:DUF4440 domain-containing protein n=1 Tax=Caballeronia novacaledonica TaxID=1544861 RepID=A0AA37IBZ1_9BURK|nr:nuclear transport factor 2 family protein [Caballeronia novacaledonica]GJH27070.1 DUF4440 domain-containing protein [Caballeronia novacaledonica]